MDYVSERSGKIFGLIFFPGWILVLLSVVLRYFFNMPSAWAGDMAKYLFATYFVVGGAYCLFVKAHIRVDIIYNICSSRIKKVIELFLVFPLLFAFVFPFIWQGSIFAWKSLKFMEISPPPTNFILFPVKFMLPISGIIFLAQGIVDLYRNLTGNDNAEGVSDNGK